MLGFGKIYDFEVMTLEITSACPCRCVGCYYYLEKGPRIRKSIELITFKKIMDKTPTVRNLVLSGGEPFAHKYLDKLCIVAAFNKIKPSILTSGAVLPSPGELKNLKPFIHGVVVTVKYPELAKDSYWKGIPEKRNHAFELLERLKAMGIKRYIHWTIDRMNQRYYEQMKELAKHYKADLEILRFLSFSREFDQYQMTPWEFFRYRMYPNPLCPAGVKRCNINLWGDVGPCIYSGHVVGNVLRDPWEVIQKNLYAWREMQGGEQYRCLADVKNNG